MNDDFGFKRREKQRQVGQQARREHASEILHRLWADDYWDEESVLYFYAAVKEEFDAEFTSPRLQAEARKELQKFIKEKNEGDLQLTVPGKFAHVKRQPLTKNRFWLKSGMQVLRLNEKVQNHWRKQSEYSEAEALGWLLFSALVWGGLNDAAALDSLLVYVRKKSHLQSLDTAPVCNLGIVNSDYGNVQLSNGRAVQSVSFVPDVMTQLWLIRCYRTVRVMKANRSSWDRLLQAAVHQVDPTFDLETLFSGASYVWEQTPRASIPQVLYRVATSAQPCCSLSAHDFATTQNHDLTSHIPDIRRSGLELAFSGSGPRPEDTRDAVEKENDRFRARLRSVIGRLPESMGKARRQYEKEAFEKLMDEFEEDHHQRLIGWVHDMAIDRTRGKTAKKGLANSTIERVFSAVAKPWLSQTNSEYLDQLDSEAFELLYERCLKESTEIDSKKCNSSFQQFHKFQIKAFDAPPADIAGESSAEICKARFLSPRFMHCAIDSLRRNRTLNINDKETLECMLVLAWRTGMRIGEVCRIRLNDCSGLVEIDNVIVRPSRGSRVKTPNAYRRIPVKSLLTPLEYSRLLRVWQYRHRVKKADSDPLFSRANSAYPFFPSYLGHVFRVLTDGVLPDNGYTLHSLRHTALTTLSLILSQNHRLLALFSDLSPSQHDAIRTELVGHQHRGQDHYFAVASFAGHGMPDQTFRSYLHFSHLMIGFELLKSDRILSYRIVDNLLGRTPHALRGALQDVHNASTPLEKGIPLHQLTSTTSQLLSQWTYDWERVLDKSTESCMTSKVSSNAEKQATPSPGYTELEQMKAIIMRSALPGQPKNRATMVLVYQMLMDIETGKFSLSQAATAMDIPIDLLERWVTRAQVLSAMRTGRGGHRLIGKDRLKPGRVVLTPAPLKHPEERRQVEQFFQKAALMYQTQPIKLLAFLSIYLRKATNARSIIRFTYKQQSQMELFITVGTELLGVTQWRMHTPNKQAISTVRNLGKRFRSLEVSKTPLVGYDGIGFTVIHPAEEQLIKNSTAQSVYSSSVLRHAVHMLLITWPCGHLAGRFRDPVLVEETRFKNRIRKA